MEFPIYKVRDLKREIISGEYFNSDFASLIDELIQRDELENVIEKGIAQKVSIDGTEGLSVKQSFHLQKIFDRYNNQRCSVCDEVISLNEVLDMDGGTMCSYHQRLWDKDE
jgi:hypothetical protein